MLPVPNNVEDYLTMRFGSDFMRMPSPRTLEAFPSHLISFDLGSLPLTSAVDKSDYCFCRDALSIQQEYRS